MCVNNSVYRCPDFITIAFQDAFRSIQKVQWVRLVLHVAWGVCLSFSLHCLCNPLLRLSLISDRGTCLFIYSVCYCVSPMLDLGATQFRHFVCVCVCVFTAGNMSTYSLCTVCYWPCVYTIIGGFGVLLASGGT